MPTKAEIYKEIVDGKARVQDTVRHKHLAAAAKISERNTILYATGWTSAKKYQGIPQGLFSLTTDDVAGFMAAVNGLKGDTLDLILHSPGGSLEASDQIVQYLRGKFSHIRAIIPHNAMSAATMLACACDEIIMGRQSAIGPIDPQLSWGNVSAAAQSLLDELETARKDVVRDPKLATIWATRLKDYPPGIFETCSTTMALSKEKVQDWLSRYMFKDDADRVTKSFAIASWLASATEHKSHGRPIGFDLCLAQGLKVKRLEDEQKFQDAILSVFHASAITFDVTNNIKIIENHKGRGHYVSVQAPKN